MSDVMPEGRDSSMGSTIGDEATTDEELRGPEELDDVTDDGTLGDGTLGDGELADGGDVLDEILANHGSAGLNDPGMTSDPTATGSGEPDDQPVLLDGDAMGRPVSGSMNDDDQGMENAGRNLGG